MLIVPVLDEQSVIEESVLRFGELTDRFDWLRVLYVTTVRERGSPTTHSMLGPLLAERRAIEVVRSSERDGVMAHQLNHAIGMLRERRGEFALGIYNVDSDPGEAALVHARDRLAADPDAVLQQYAAYPVQPGSSRTLQHAVAWQNRWSLQFELGRALGESRVLGPAGRLARARLPRPFHYVIGHGLFMSSGTWARAGGFPEDEINEDAFLGVILARLGVVPEPVPYLELAEGAPSLAALIRQQATWFNGPLFAARYSRKVLVRIPGERARTVLAGAQLQMHSVYWLLGPPTLILVVPVALALRGDTQALAAWVALVAAFTAGLSQLAAEALRRAGYPVGRPLGAAGGVVAYALHCAGPLYTCARTASGRNVMSAKHKTPRAADARDPCAGLLSSAARVFVCGNGGSGKTHLARRLAAQLGVPVLEVDRVRWAPGWVRRPTEEVQSAVERFASQPGWVAEDGSLEVLELLAGAADAVVWADPPVLGCALRVLRRSLARALSPGRAGAGRERPGMVLRHVRWCLRYPRERRPRHAAALERHPGLVHLTSWSAVRACGTAAGRGATA